MRGCYCKRTYPQRNYHAVFASKRLRVAYMSAILNGEDAEPCRGFESARQTFVPRLTCYLPAAVKVSGIDLKTITGREVILVEDIIDTGAWGNGMIARLRLFVRHRAWQGATGQQRQQ